jgi:hypothetical protein
VRGKLALPFPAPADFGRIFRRIPPPAEFSALCDSAIRRRGRFFRGTAGVLFYGFRFVLMAACWRAGWRTADS